MGKKLAKNVHVDGNVYKAGSEVSDEVAEQITNPNAWAEDDTEGDGDKPAPKAGPAAKK